MCKRPPRLELYNDHVEIINGLDDRLGEKRCCGARDTYCILLRDIEAIHVGFARAPLALFIAMLCLVALPIAFSIDSSRSSNNDGENDTMYVYGSLLALFVFFILGWLFLLQRSDAVHWFETGRRTACLP
jgi:hypothetical protein